jgi:predicted nucleic acid-binding protein
VCNRLYRKFTLSRRRSPRCAKALAVNGQADLIVTGDADLLALNPFRGIPIVTPAVFVQGAAR